MLRFCALMLNWNEVFIFIMIMLCSNVSSTWENALVSAFYRLISNNVSGWVHDYKKMSLHFLSVFNSTGPAGVE